MQTQIPVIDLGSALAGDPAARLRTGREIDRTCTDIGFFTITGHGVPEEVIRGLNSKAHAFFALPMQEKLEVMEASGIKVTRTDAGTQSVMIQIVTEGWPNSDPIEQGRVTFTLRRYDRAGKADEEGGDWRVDVIETD